MKEYQKEYLRLFLADLDNCTSEYPIEEWAKEKYFLDRLSIALFRAKHEESYDFTMALTNVLREWLLKPFTKKKAHLDDPE